MSPHLLLGAVLAIVGAFLAGDIHGHQSERATWQAKVEEARAEASESARHQEQVKQGKINEALRKENERMARINAGLADDIDELRNRPPRRVPKTTGTSCEGATGAELSGSDAQFLAGLAARADRHRAALEACYEYADTVTAR